MSLNVLRSLLRGVNSDGNRGGPTRLVCDGSATRWFDEVADAMLIVSAMPINGLEM